MIFRVRKRINLLLESTAVTHHHDDVLADIVGPDPRKARTVLV